jgi:methyltransferase
VTPTAVAALSLAVVALSMLGELLVSRRNEQRLLAQGAIEPADPVYATMRWAYPAVFIAMTLEAVLAARQPGVAALAGAALFLAAKALKFWAIAALGARWTYRVLVIPGAPLIRTGPYRFIRHPNYVAVVGELVGMALLTSARFSGPLCMAFFTSLLYRRIVSEERALGLSPGHHGRT